MSAIYKMSKNVITNRILRSLVKKKLSQWILTADHTHKTNKGESKGLWTGNIRSTFKSKVYRKWTLKYSDLYVYATKTLKFHIIKHQVERVLKRGSISLQLITSCLEDRFSKYFQTPLLYSASHRRWTFTKHKQI